MSIRSLASLKIFFESLPGGSKSVTPTDMQNTTPPESEFESQLSNGPNLIEVPPLAKGVVIIPHTASTVQRTLKGISGDTGIRISTNTWTVLSFPGGGTPSDFILSLNAEDTGFTRFIFF